MRIEVVARGHDCWTIPDAGLDGENDDEISVYATERGAVLVTDDRELIQRRTRNLFGKTLRIRGKKTEATAIVRARLDEAVELLQSTDELIVEISAAGARILAPPWLV